MNMNNLQTYNGFLNESWFSKPDNDIIDKVISKIEKHDSNPIKTSYELLWAEVRAGLAKLDRCISEEIAL